MEDLKTLKGEVDSIIFKSEDTGFCVLMLNCDNDLITVLAKWVTLRRAKISL